MALKPRHTRLEILAGRRQRDGRAGGGPSPCKASFSQGLVLPCGTPGAFFCSLSGGGLERSPSNINAHGFVSRVQRQSREFFNCSRRMLPANSRSSVMTFGRPPGLPDLPGSKGRPLGGPSIAVLSLFSAGILSHRTKAKTSRKRFTALLIDQPGPNPETA
jgi:hypothetical protein